LGLDTLQTLIQPFLWCVRPILSPQNQSSGVCGAFIGATGDDLLLAEVRAIDFYLFYSIFIYFLFRAHKMRALGVILETSGAVTLFFRGWCVVCAWSAPQELANV
jgi:hypothetical protein